MGQNIWVLLPSGEEIDHVPSFLGSEVVLEDGHAAETEGNCIEYGGVVEAFVVLSGGQNFTIRYRMSP